MPVNGLHLVTPTSTAKTGSSSTATINANGSVTFATCETLSLNGVFSADYDNYMVVLRHSGSSNNGNLCLRLRASGTDNSGTTSYRTEELEPSGANIFGSRITGNRWFSSYTCAGGYGGQVMYVYAPFLTQTTAFRSTSVYDIGSVGYMEDAGTHDQSTSYDGLSLISSATFEMTGLIAVYGLRN